MRSQRFNPGWARRLGTLLLGLIALLAPARAAHAQCAQAANISSFTFQSKRYEIVKEKRSWTAAAACAVARGGHLVYIESSAEQTAVYNAIVAAGISPSYGNIDDGGGISYIWIGATDQSVEGDWIWDGTDSGTGTLFWQGDATGSPVLGRYNNWGSDGSTQWEPDNFAGTQNFAAIGLAKWPAGVPGVTLGTAGQWNDINGAGPCYYVIEYEAGAPTITSITPTSGPEGGGTTITIQGTNLAGASVTVGGSAASSVVTTATSLTAVTPAGSPGAADIVVTNGVSSVTRTGAFTYIAAPAITAVTPSSGAVAGGNTVVITGTNLSGASVTIGGARATVLANSSTVIGAVTPAGTAGARNLVVTTSGGSATLVGGFTYVAAPTITSVTPASGPLGGNTSITITGTNLAGATFTVGGAAATSIVASATSVTGKTPAGTVGTKNIVLTTVGGSTTKTSAFTYVAAPTITAVSPAAGPSAGGTSIVVTGTNLAGATLTVGGTAATSVVAGANSITARTPAGIAGAKTVVVTTAGGLASKSGAFTYLDPPVVTGISPSTGPAAGGTIINLIGTSLTGATVKVGGVSATNVSTSPTLVYATVPAGSAGAKTIVVTTPGGSTSTLAPVGGTSSTLAFTYVSAPTITTISPASGTTRGGTTIMVSGTNLTGATLTINGVRATIFASSATVLGATTPAGSAGAKDVTVKTAGGSATKTGGFTYVVNFTGEDDGDAPVRRADRPGPRSASPLEDPATPVPTMGRCIQLILQSSFPMPDCAPTACGDMPSLSVDPLTDGPEGPDLDGNAMPDLCQLRCGDLDMNGRLDAGDVALLTMLIGDEPVLGIGDLDSNGAIDQADLAELLLRTGDREASAPDEAEAPPTGT